MTAKSYTFVLFDLDGTLSDPLLGIARSFNYALSHFGFAPLESSQVSAYIGPPLDEAFRAITGVTFAADVDALVAKYRERYADVGFSENVLYPGIREALTSLSTSRVPLGICTSKRKDFAEQILEMFGLRAYFRVVSGGDIGIHKSEQIQALLAAGTISNSCLMIGDRAIDIQAAHRNGLCAAGVLWGYGSSEELEQQQPEHLLHSPAELPALVEKCRPIEQISR